MLLELCTELIFVLLNNFISGQDDVFHAKHASADADSASTVDDVTDNTDTSTADVHNAKQVPVGTAHFYHILLYEFIYILLIQCAAVFTGFEENFYRTLINHNNNNSAFLNLENLS